MTTPNKFTSIQFGICVIEDGLEKYYLIPIDLSVQNVLVEMLETFEETYKGVDEIKKEFEISEKYGSSEKLYMKTSNEHISRIKNLFVNKDIPTNNIDISETLADISFYFVIYNKGDKRLIGVKRPTQFKGLLKNKNKLIQVVDDTLKAVNDEIFKLDKEFDFVVSDQEVKILHPSGFVFISDVYEYVLETAEKTTAELGSQIKFLETDNLSKFVGKSKTAARLIASIRLRNDLSKIRKERLMDFCKSAGIKLVSKGNKFEPEEKGMLDFLRLLDRRLYEMELTDEKELYIAESRHKK